MNLFILVDPYNRYTQEEKNIFPKIEKENKSFGSFLGYVLQQEYDKGNKILVWSNDSNLGVMKEIPKKIYKLYKGKLPKNYHNIFLCGFHYGICVEEAARILKNRHQIPSNQVGIVVNLTLPAPEQPVHKIENFFKSDFQLYYWTNQACIPIELNQL